MSVEQTQFSVELWIINYPEKDGFMTRFAQRFSRNIRLRIWYIYITTIPKQVCFIVKVELPSVSIDGWLGADVLGRQPGGASTRVGAHS